MKSRKIFLICLFPFLIRSVNLKIFKTTYFLFYVNLPQHTKKFQEHFNRSFMFYKTVNKYKLSKK